MKFVQYANAYEWTEEDCKVCLLHCLLGKALDYCTRLMRAQADIPYDTLLRKLQERFGAELQASAQAKFNLATQARSETMEDWADRVQELALEAFIGLPEHCANSQSIARFCQGLNDMDAGHSAFMKNHDTIEKAMNDIRLYQHSKKDMMSRRPRRAAVSMTAEDYEDPQVCAVSSKLDELAVMRKQLSDLTTMMAKMSTYRPMPPRRRFPTRRPQSGCFNCGERNHFARECPHPEKKTPLNPKGGGADGRHPTQDGGRQVNVAATTGESDVNPKQVTSEDPVEKTGAVDFKPVPAPRKSCAKKPAADTSNSPGNPGPVVEVCMLQSLSSVTIPVRVGGIPVEAVVDSAAQVTIISDRIFNKLKNPPKKIHTLSLQTAGRQMYMQGFIADPLGVNIGQSYYKGPIYVAPIQQDMLFGMDLIQRGGHHKCGKRHIHI